MLMRRGGSSSLSAAVGAATDSSWWRSVPASLRSQRRSLSSADPAVEARPEPPHVPVLMPAVMGEVELLIKSRLSDPASTASYAGLRIADLTLGAGGHSWAMLGALPASGSHTLLGVDQDEHALQLAKQNLESCKPSNASVEFHHSNFSDFLKSQADGSLDFVLMDLGVSSMQLNDPQRGMSFRTELMGSGAGDIALDMRMDRSRGNPAHVLVNTSTESELGRIFKEYGQEPRWRDAARAVVSARHRLKNGIQTVDELIAALDPVLFHRKSAPGRSPKHPMTLAFQALRIATNGELEHLRLALAELPRVLRPKGGRAGVISFHSLEDGMVKRAFKELGSKSYSISKDPIGASPEEIAANPRSRSAKLRVLVKN